MDNLLALNEKLVSKGLILEEQAGKFLIRSAKTGEELVVVEGSRYTDIEKAISELETATENDVAKLADEAISKTGISKYGQRLDEIGEVIENGFVKGKYSQRVFDPNNAGGAIQKLNWRNAQIDPEGISIIRKHISRLEHDVWNDGMLQRLDKILKGKIQVTEFDLRYYTHEIQEFNRYKALGFENTPYSQISESVWDNAHAATLEDFQLHEIMQYNNKSIRSLYHPNIQK